MPKRCRRHGALCLLRRTRDAEGDFADMVAIFAAHAWAFADMVRRNLSPPRPPAPDAPQTVCKCCPMMNILLLYSIFRHSSIESFNFLRRSAYFFAGRKNRARFCRFCPFLRLFCLWSPAPVRIMHLSPFSSPSVQTRKKGTDTSSVPFCGAEKEI